MKRSILYNLGLFIACAGIALGDIGAMLIFVPSGVLLCILAFTD